MIIEKNTIDALENRLYVIFIHFVSYVTYLFAMCNDQKRIVIRNGLSLSPAALAGEGGKEDGGRSAAV